ncbi:16S rRNA (guanine(527)-N(7))-methyltransferase RsmG [Acidisoma sp.]|uniref:16S rRNA (guanine(527)-N(7))-methyltransferase RsmG n=1 Tax=Acidisoma sp. TaxID=1872115 RepID=UPI003B000A35
MEVFHVKHHEPLMELMPQHEDDHQFVIDVGPAIRDQLLAFSHLLLRWNPAIKLVSTKDLAHLWSRHINDALQLAPLMPPDVDHAVDLGSGGGFPGLVLALATGVHFDLVESDTRKAAFLQEAVTLTKANATVHATRIENVGLKPRMILSARALAPLSRLLELSYPLLEEAGISLFPKGERAEAEIAEASRTWAMDVERIQSRTSPSGLILRIKNLRRREVAFS